MIYAMGWVDHGESMKLNRQTDRFEPYLDGLSADCLDYSPDGQWIAYVSYPARELWKCRRDGSDKVLLEDSLDIYMPRWSPDGKRLAFAATRKGGAWSDPFRIYTIAVEGGKAEPVKGVNGPGFDPQLVSRRKEAGIRAVGLARARSEAGSARLDRGPGDGRGANGTWLGGDVFAALVTRWETSRGAHGAASRSSTISKPGAGRSSMQRVSAFPIWSKGQPVRIRDQAAATK